jgi:hypothetical protein
MKKILYILLLVVVCAATFTACSEDEVTPKTENTNGGGNGQDPIKNG